MVSVLCDLANKSFGLLFLLLSISICVLTGCIDSAKIDPAGFDDYLVVEGFITDEYGPHQVSITRVARFSGKLQGGAIRKELRAQVDIIDQNGIKTRLIEDRFHYKELSCKTPKSFQSFPVGFKTPDTFKGEVGNTYILEIRTPEGKVYRSKPQTIVRTPEIQDLELSFFEKPTSNDLVPESGVEVFSVFQDPVESKDFYFWRLNGIYRISTPPLANPSPNCPCTYDPDDGGAEECWIYENDLEGNVTSFNDVLVNGQLVKKSIGFVVDDSKRFASVKVTPDKQYYLEVEQYRINEDNYNFNDRINTLESIDGEIFDPPPLSVRGNIYNMNDSSEIVIGYFGAYQVKRKDIFIPSSVLKFKKPFPPICGDCRVFWGSQTEIPDVYK